MKLLLCSVVLSVSVALFSPLVRADMAPPEAEECYSKKAGDNCTVYGTSLAGHCAVGMCTKLWRDGGSSSYSCPECVQGAPSDSSCTLGSQIAVKRIGPWALAGLFSLLVLFGRRRRRR
jgi:hypothetical protein